MWDYIIFGQLPYVLIAIGIVGTIYRYAANRFLLVESVVGVS